MSKIFGIGFHKTGTSSLGKALEILGYKNCYGASELSQKLGEANLMRSLFEGDYESIFEFADNYEAFNDLPWLAIYKDLDKRFLNSKFILTTRDKDSWILSAKAYFGETVSPLRLWLYGKSNPINDEKAYVDRYEKHNNDVLEYFSGRNCLLTLDINHESKWEILCQFLGKPIPQMNFPHLNVKGKR